MNAVIKQWLILGLTFLVVIVVRVRLLDLPLERDEGEYAYAGQLILQGVPPYQEVFNMKLPGTYAAYAVIMAIFGQTPAGIHFGLLLVNLASILLVYLIGRRLFDAIGANAAAVAFALMSMSPFILGLAGHATHFVTLFALLGIYSVVTCGQQVLANVPSRTAAAPMQRHPSAWKFFLAGIFLGLAFVMKQHGVFFGVFGVLYLGFILFYQRFLIREWCREKRITSAVAKAGGHKSEGCSQQSAVSSQKPGSELSTLNHPSAIATATADHPSTPPKRLSHFAAGKLKQNVSVQSVETEGVLQKETKVGLGEQGPQAGDQFALANGPSSDARGQQSPVPGLQSSQDGLGTMVNGPPSEHKGPGKLTNEPTQPVIPSACSWFAMIALVAGLAAPYLLTCLILLAAGVFSEFWFWTMSYAAQYGSAISFDTGVHLLRKTLHFVASPDLPLWVIPWFGLLVVWWDQRVAIPTRFLLVALLVTSLGSVSLGFYFRDHYFITLLPVISLLTGAAVSRGVHLIRHERSLELVLAIPIVLLLLVGIGASLIGNGGIWFGARPEFASREIYGSTLPRECLAVGDYLKQHVPKESRVAVLGSEPQINFYSHRRGATGYIYMYPLMETHAYASKMQADLIARLEKDQPEWIVYVDDGRSWLRQEKSDHRLDDWWTAYWASHLDLVETFQFETGLQSIESIPGVTDRHSITPAKVAQVMVFKRKAAAKAPG